MSFPIKNVRWGWLNVLILVIAWLMVPEVLMATTGTLFGGGEWAIWAALFAAGLIVIWVRRRKPMAK